MHLKALPVKPAAEWSAALAGQTMRRGVELVQGRGPDSSLRVDGVLFHSLYQPREEAKRLIDSANLDPQRPVLVVGLGLGYHVSELLTRGFEVAVLEPDPSVASLALSGPASGLAFMLGVGDLDKIAHTEEFGAFAQRNPQTLVHQPTARINPAFIDGAQSRIARAALDDQHLGIAIVGPMYGGSLPIAEYLANAFKKLGHRVLFVDNSQAWPLYQEVARSVDTKHANAQLTHMLVNLLGEWSYARVAEFDPNLCIVMAQAPVGPEWPTRLIRHECVTAYWFVENWRHMPYWRDIAPRYDAFFHIQPGEFEAQLASVGCKHHAYVQTACDPDVHFPETLSDDEQIEFGCDIAFAGAGYLNRNTLFQGLTDYNLKLWGVDWSVRELQRFVCRKDKRFGPEEFRKIVAGSKININLHASATHTGVDPRCDAVNPRVFEIAACGGFQVCDACAGLEQLMDFETELPVYRDLAGLRDLIAQFIKEPDKRAAYANRARQHVLREHTYVHRAQQMLDFILEHHAPRILKKGVRVQRTIGEVAERVGHDSTLGRYLASLPPDRPFTQESINEFVPVMGTPLSEPEALFSYLREMRTGAEQLLAAMEGQ